MVPVSWTLSHVIASSQTVGKTVRCDAFLDKNVFLVSKTNKTFTLYTCIKIELEIEVAFTPVYEILHCLLEQIKINIIEPENWSSFIEAAVFLRSDEILQDFRGEMCLPSHRGSSCQQCTTLSLGVKFGIKEDKDEHFILKIIFFNCVRHVLIFPNLCL